MELQLNNMLEVGEIISALEKRLDWYVEMQELNKRINSSSECFKSSKEAVINIYNQFKKTYKDYYPFKY